MSHNAFYLNLKYLEKKKRDVTTNSSFITHVLLSLQLKKHNPSQDVTDLNQIHHSSKSQNGKLQGIPGYYSYIQCLITLLRLAHNVTSCVKTFFYLVFFSLLQICPIVRPLVFQNSILQFSLCFVTSEHIFMKYYGTCFGAAATEPLNPSHIYFKRKKHTRHPACLQEKTAFDLTVSHLK